MNYKLQSPGQGHSMESFVWSSQFQQNWLQEIAVPESVRPRQAESPEAFCRSAMNRLTTMCPVASKLTAVYVATLA